MDKNMEAIERLNHALEQVQQEMEAMECHGLLTGMICAKGKVSEEEWVRFISQGRDESSGGEALAIFRALHGETLRQLEDSVLDFHPLLPDDDDGLEERIVALGDWVQGFLLGISEGGIKELEALPEASAEIIRDFAEIAGAARYEVDESEEDESAYTDLLEYVRTGVLLVNEELNPTKAPPRENVTIH